MIKKSKPSYGVFMVDIFASSVGIFILVSLLYMIMSSQTTSSAAMVERFKMLVKRDEVPIHSYSLPHQKDPLHDWGVRATHARIQKEALVLLLRDKILLYHTGETLTIAQMIDSTKLLHYFKKYNKRQRLFLEIHYNDAYHAIYTKIQQSLPQNVSLWTHWAFNAGNINNPNPTAADMQQTQQLLRQGDADPRLPNEDGEEGRGSSLARNPSQQRQTGGGAMGDPTQQGHNEGDASANGINLGNEQTQHSPGSEGDGINDSHGEAGNNDAQQGQSNGENNGENNSLLGPEPSADEASGSESSSASKTGVWPRKDTDPMAGDETQSLPDIVRKQITEQLNQNHSAERFIKRFMSEQPPSTAANNPQNATQSPSQNPSQQSGSSSSGSSSDKRASDKTKTPEQKAQEQAQAQAQKKAAQSLAKAQEIAEKTIKKNTFLAVPLYSPIHHFMLNVQVPGYVSKRFTLDAVQLKLHQQANGHSIGHSTRLVRGDYLVPVSANHSTMPSHTPQWHQMKVMKVQQTDAPQTGWLYGMVLGEVFMMPVQQNVVQSPLRREGQYWFKQPTKNTQSDAFNDALINTSNDTSKKDNATKQGSR